MANREFKSLDTNQTGLVCLDGYVCLGSNAAVDATNSVLLDMAAVKTTTGIYTITLADPYISVVSVTASVASNASGLAKSVEVGAVTVGNPTTVVLRTVNTSGAAADVTAACGLFVHIVCKNSSVR